MPTPAPLGTFGGMLTLVSVADGEGNAYSVETNHDKIYKFYTRNFSEPSFSPTSLIYWVHDVSLSGDGIRPVGEYTDKISLIGQVNRINNIWDLLEDLHGFPFDGGDPVLLSTVARTIPQSTNTISFNYTVLFNYNVEVGEATIGGVTHENTAENVAIFKDTLLSILKSENCCAIIEAYSTNGQDLLATGTIPIEFGTSEEMAKFAVTANAIQAAVNDTKLTFDADGLTIRNGGLVIYNDTNEKVFYFDTINNYLKIVGSGEFTGKITATEGSFTGDVIANNLVANSGTIGNFTIQGNGLTSEDGLLKIISDHDTGSRIDVGTINLGEHANIQKYIKLGDKAFIWNPDHADALRNVIEIKNVNGDDVITLKDTGILNLGQIILDGNESKISGNSFSITPQLASFSNVSVSGKISTVVFEKGHIQSVGGLMMFKPSYKIESYNGNVLTLDQKFIGTTSPNHYVYVIDDAGECIGTYKINEINEKQVTLENFSYGKNVVSLIDIGTENDLIIGVNSSTFPNALLRPRGITISEFKADGTFSNPKVYLGDLDSSNIDFSDAGISKNRGFGLYSENVYLTGSLTTKVDNSSFAGVNTLDGVDADKIPGDTSKIVFWAGSASVQATDIQNAPFQVTEDGSIYAARGIFTGSILVNSNITGADIYAARIHGTGPEGDGLSFYDTSKGIVFYKGDYGNSPTEVFSLGTDGLKKGNDYFTKIGSSIDFIGNNFYTKITGQNLNRYIRLSDNYIAGAYIDGVNGEKIDTKIELGKNSSDNTGKIKLSISGSEKMNITQNKIEMSTNEVQINNVVLFGNQLKYEQVNDGYNLFVMG